MSEKGQLILTIIFWIVFTGVGFLFGYMMGEKIERQKAQGLFISAITKQKIMVIFGTEYVCAKYADVVKPLAEKP